MKYISAVCIAVVIFSSNLWARTPAEKKITEDKKLLTILAPLVKNFHGTAGIYVRNLKTGREAAINADTVFPTASMIKTTIMCGLFAKIEDSTYKYDQQLTYRDSLLYPGADILGAFKDSAKIALGEVAMLMITTSDNTAALWCQGLAGTGTAINALLEKYGFEKTRVNSRTPGREAARKLYGWGQTTPREMSELFVKIRDGKIVSPEASERMYRNLCRIYWDGGALSEIPPTVHAASKQGMVDDSKSETVLVNAPSGDYVFCVITKDQKDQRWEYDNEGSVLLREVSKTLWHYYEPRSKWMPGAHPQKWH